MLSFHFPLRSPSTRFAESVSGPVTLPDPHACGDDAVLRDFALLAGGLALLLSRCSPRMRERHFPKAHRAHACIRDALARDELPRLGGDFLSDLAHEIAPYVDAATRQAANRCMRQAARGTGAALA